MRNQLRHALGDAIEQRDDIAQTAGLGDADRAIVVERRPPSAAGSCATSEEAEGAHGDAAGGRGARLRRAPPPKRAGGAHHSRSLVHDAHVVDQILARELPYDLENTRPDVEMVMCG